jgi:hypothetical protein
LGYFKQGDDLHFHLEEEKNNVRAFRAHAANMRAVAEHLEQVATVLGDFPKANVNIDAGVHFITLEGPPEVVDALLSKELAVIPSWIEEEGDDEEFRAEEMQEPEPQESPEYTSDGDFFDPEETQHRNYEI